MQDINTPRCNLRLADPRIRVSGRGQRQAMLDDFQSGYGGTNGARFVGRFREDPGFMTHLHYHPNTDEQVYVIEGVLSVYIDERWHELGPGTLSFLPRGKPHAQGNRVDKPVHFVGSGAPAGFEKLFPAVDALMKRMKPGTPEFIAEFQQIMSRCDIVSLGSAPM